MVCNSSFQRRAKLQFSFWDSANISLSIDVKLIKKELISLEKQASKYDRGQFLSNSALIFDLPFIVIFFPNSADIKTNSKSETQYF
jgi:hypothetical protein